MVLISLRRSANKPVSLASILKLPRPRFSSGPVFPGTSQEAPYVLLSNNHLQQLRTQMTVERQAQRYPTRLVVTKINAQPVSNAVLLDISSLGAKLESPASLAPGYPIDIAFFFPGAPIETNLTGMVKWMRPLLTATGRFLMGVEFYVPSWHLDQLGRADKL